MASRDAVKRLSKALPGLVHTGKEDLREAGRDVTDHDPVQPMAVVKPTQVEHLRTLLALAKEHQLTLTLKEAGLNVGGLSLPAHRGVVVDCSGMNRILSVDEENMVAVLEPGVSFGQLKDHLDQNHPSLCLGFTTAPPRVSVLGNALMDGHTNLALHHGPTSEWIHGLEVLLPDGTLCKTGAWALTKTPFGRPPLPDLSGLFVGTYGTLGVVTKVAVALQRAPAHRKRYFVLVKDRNVCFTLMKRLNGIGLFDDLGGMSWATGKMLFGVMHPREKDPEEPHMFAYVDLSAMTPKEMDLKYQAFDDALFHLRRQGAQLEGPIAVEDLIALDPSFARYASFPMTLDFLIEHPGEGLTFVGCFGPVSRLEAAAALGEQVYEKHGAPPVYVSRFMKHGHYAVLHHVATFHRNDPRERSRARKLNIDLVKAMFKEGYLMYKTPDWAFTEVYNHHLDPGFAALYKTLRATLDPDGLLNPDRLPF